jgi:hypothetical protein
MSLPSWRNLFVKAVILRVVESLREEARGFIIIR